MADKKISSRSYPPQSVISWSSASASQWSSKSASTVPSTILKQSSPVEPTVLMHDSRLPKELDKTKPTTKRRQTTKSSTNTSTNNNTSLHSPNQKQKTDPRRRSLSPLSQHSSTTSCTTDTTNSLVYVRDCHYVWLPAQIESLMEEVDDDNIDINDTHKSGDNDINYNIDGDNKRHHIDVGIRVKGVNTTVVAKIVLPDDWVDTTDLHNNSSITEIEFNLHSAGNKTGAGRGGGGNSFGKFPTMSKTRNMNVNNDIDPTVLPEHKEQQQQQKRTYHYERCLDELNPKIPKGVNRIFSLKDYPHRELPLQNIERPRTRRRSSVRGLMTPTTIDNSNGFNRSSTNGRNKKNSKAPSPTLVNARDMADLSFLHEAAILYNLKLRHAKRLPYTRVGDIVVAVNPFQWIDGLYSLEKQAIYAQHLVWDIKDCDDYGDGYDNSNTNIKNDSRGTNKDSRKHKSRENSPDSYASDANEIDTVTSLPKNDLETKHQPMAHGSFYSRLGLEPHVYESASLAYRGLAGDQQNQTILVSGESGAGKTETVKIVMSNLATIEQTRPFYHDEIVKERDDGGKVADGVTGIVRQVLESNPLFEAFGCAKTAKNANSSRFGRFTQLQFEVEDLYDAVMNQRRSLPECLLVGSYCETYLLEKSRVVSHAQGERTYHIFYQLLAAPDEEKIRIWECLEGTTSESFSYVGVSPCSSIEGKSDADTWRQTVKALKLFGFDGQVLRNLIRALCIVLQLGNLTFKPSSDDDDGSIISSIDELNKLAKLMGIPEDQITKAMTVRVNKIRSEEVVVRSNPVDAKSGCDALAKTIYSQIFDTLVQQINYHTSVDAKDNCDRRNIGTISLLDIFGFEKFDTNRFEQLCINYANERLQQRYVLDNFKAVREEYTAEGIEIFDFSMVDNSPVVELLEGKSCIIASLNEECLRPQGSAQSFVYKLKMAHGDKDRLLTDRLQDQNEFGIKHFAGAVTYDATEFLKNNTDLTPQDLLECACKSTNPLIRDEFKKLVKLKQSSRHGMSNRKSMSSKRTVMAKFRSQLNDLMKYIEQTSVRYIRCIKPNASMKPRLTNHRQTMNQLESAGLVTAITISRETFPNRLKYELIWERFLCLYKADVTMNANRLFSISNSISFTEEQLKENVEEMLTTLLTIPFVRVDGARVPSFSCGKTKVYFRTGALEQLEYERMDYYSLRADTIQAWFRCHSARKKYNKIRRLIILVQARVRGIITRDFYSQAMKSIVLIQSTVRGFVKQNAYNKIRTSTILIQSLFRCKVAQWEYKTSRQLIIVSQARAKRNILQRTYIKKRESAKKVQSVYRGFMDRKAYINAKTSVILIQAFFKGRRDHLQYLQLLKDLVLIQSRIRGWLAQRHSSIVRKSVIKIQSRCRTHVEMQTYKKARKSCILIQSYFRVALARTCVLRMRQYANLVAKVKEVACRVIQIQQWYRWHTARKFYGNLKHSITAIQARHRGALIRTTYQLKLQSVIYIQRWYRSHNEAKREGRVVQALYQRKLRSALHIQRWYRCHNIRSSYRSFKESVTTAQRWYRSHSEARHKGRTARESYQRKLQSILHIQRWYRSRSQIRHRDSAVRKSYEQSVIQVQQWYRWHTARKFYGNLKHSIITVQARHRGALIRSTHQQSIWAAITVQRVCRAFLARNRVVRMKLLARAIEKAKEATAASTKIQQWYRRHSNRQSYIYIQRSILIIQRIYRSSKTRKSFKQETQSVRSIQRWYSRQIKAKREGRVVRESYQRKLRSALHIQRWYRSHSEARHKGRTAWKSYHQILQSVLIIQRWYRCRSIRSSYRSFKRSVTIAQARCRGVLARKDYKQKLKSVIVIQSFIRMLILRMDYLLKREMKDIDITQNSINNAREESHPLAVHFTFSKQSSDGKIQNCILSSLSASHNDSLETTISSLQKKISQENVAKTDGSALKEVESAVIRLRQQLMEVQRENSTLMTEKEELENDKSSLVNYANTLQATVKMANSRSRELHKSNQMLISGISDIQKQNSSIRRKLLLIQEERDADLAPMQRKFQRLLYDRDSEIRALKIAAATNIDSRSQEATRKEKTFDKERESYLAEIHKLKKLLKEKNDAKGGYNEKLITVLETSQSTRNQETRRLKKEIKKLKRDLDDYQRNIEEENVVINQDDVSNLIDFLESRHSVRDQLLHDIITSVNDLGMKEFAPNEPKRRMGAFRKKRHSTSPSKTSYSLDNAAVEQLTKSIEELRESESTWQNECSEMLENTFNKPTEEPAEKQSSSNSSKRRVHYD